VSIVDALDATDGVTEDALRDVIGNTRARAVRLFLPTSKRLETGVGWKKS
jgi:hypothetical protein